MTCEYCGKIIKGQPVKEHLIARRFGGHSQQKTKAGRYKNVFNSCKSCDIKKNRYAFWSIESVNDYVNQHFSYSIWLKKRIEKIFNDPCRQRLLGLILDGKI